MPCLRCYTLTRNHSRRDTQQSTTKEFMDKFKGAMDFYTIRKDSADKRVNEWYVQ